MFEKTKYEFKCGIIHTYYSCEAVFVFVNFCYISHDTL